MIFFKRKRKEEKTDDGNEPVLAAIIKDPEIGRAHV